MWCSKDFHASALHTLDFVNTILRETTLYYIGAADSRVSLIPNSWHVMPTLKGKSEGGKRPLDWNDNLAIFEDPR